MISLNLKSIFTVLPFPSLIKLDDDMADDGLDKESESEARTGRDIIPGRNFERSGELEDPSVLGRTRKCCKKFPLFVQDQLDALLGRNCLLSRMAISLSVSKDVAVLGRDDVTIESFPLFPSISSIVDDAVLGRDDVARESFPQFGLDQVAALLGLDREAL